MNAATVIVLLVVLALVILAVVAMRKGRHSCCDVKDKKTGGSDGCASGSIDCPLKRGRSKSFEILN